MTMIFHGTVYASAYDGRHHPSKTWPLGPPALRDVMIPPGIHEVEEVGNPYLGTQVEAESKNPLEPWMMVRGFMAGGAKSWMLARAIEFPGANP